MPPSSTAFRSSRTFNDVVHDEHRSCSLLDRVFNVYPAERVMDIDCNMFPILDDPEGAGGTNKHIGTHRALMGQVIDANDGCFLAEVMTLCWDCLLYTSPSPRD